MIQVFIFILAALLAIVGLFLLKKSVIFLPLMNNSEPDENKQFLRQFAVFYLILAALGIIVGIFNLKFFSLFYIVGLLIISAVFSVMLAKKIF